MSSALEMKFYLNVVPKKTGKVPKDIVYLGERDGAASGKAELANTHWSHLRGSYCKKKDLLALEST